MTQDNTNTTPVVEETKVEETVVSTPEVKVEEKTFNQTQIDSIVAKVRTEEAQKAELTTKELQEKVEAIEKERAAEKAEIELRNKILEEANTQTKLSQLESTVASKVNDNYKESVINLTKLKLGDITEATTLELITSTIDEVINSMPAGIAKGTGNGSTVLNQAEEVKTTNPEPTIVEPGYYRNGTKLNITDEAYEKLSSAQKEVIQIKK